jgi:hypothetical protein
VIATFHRRERSSWSARGSVAAAAGDHPDRSTDRHGATT